MRQFLISFDDTGSMQSCRQQVRREVKELVNQLYQYDDTEVGVIVHGDWCDNPNIRLQKLDFTSNKQKVIDFITSAKQTGGGDSDEFYEYVLNQAREFSWKGDNKAMVLIGDAEPHKVGYSYDGVKYPYDWKTEAEALVKSGVLIYPVQCLNHRSSTYFYEGLAKLSKTPKLDLHQFADINKLLTAVSYKQESQEKVIAYGEELNSKGLLNRNLANIISLLAESKDWVGGITFDTPATKVIADGELREVDPSRFQVLSVDKDISIKEFVISNGAAKSFVVGKGFYELSKRELVQERKEIVLQNKAGDFFSGSAARDMVGLPFGERGNLKPSNVPKGYTAFVQSTSHTRKLIGGTKFLWEVNKV